MGLESDWNSAGLNAVWPEVPAKLAPMPLPTQLWVPLGKGGDEAEVKPPGTVVVAGEPLVRHAAESSHIPLAPAAGAIGRIQEIQLTSGKSSLAVELKLSAQPVAPDSTPASPAEKFPSLVSGLERIRAAGVWADRHASPDLIGQLNQVVARPIDTLICTVLDSDASLRLNAVIAARFAQQLVDGLTRLAHMVNSRRSIVAVESFAGPYWMEPLRRAAREEDLEIIDLANDYPQADPTLILYSLTRRRLQPGNFPTTRGVLVLDAAAALAVGDAMADQPMLSVPVAVHDHAYRLSHFLQVHIGTPIRHVLAELSIASEDAVIRGGDLLRDIPICPDAVIGGAELTIHVTAPEAVEMPAPCIRCAWCFEACPTLVHPALILDALQRQDMKMADRAGIAACIECGICSHVCPADLPLLQAVREIRAIKR
jgi:electron transport complex protein RnfC